MLSCWRVIPETRPSFDKLEAKLLQTLDGTLAEQYIELNEPYMEANINRFKNGNIDYLALMGSPDTKSPSIPMMQNDKYNYINNLINSGYDRFDQSA